MDAGNLGQVDVGGQAALLVLGDLLGGQVIVEVARDQVRVDRLGPVVAGDRSTVRWRVTRWTRSTSSLAKGLSATCWPISRTFEGVKVSSSQAIKVRRVSRIVITFGSGTDVESGAKSPRPYPI